MSNCASSPSRHRVGKAIRSILALAALAFGLFPTAGRAADRGYRAILAIQGETTLASANPERLLAPASLQKLIVVAAAFHHLGPDHRIETQFRGMLDDGTELLVGDLVLVAAADPSWSDRFREGDPRFGIRELVEGLQERGISRVQGNLVIDISRFPGRSIPKTRAFDEAAFALGAPTSALVVDEGSVEIKISPGSKPGDPGELVGPDFVAWMNRIETVGEHRHEKGTVDFLPRWGSDEFLVAGEYPVSEPPYRIPVSQPNPIERAASEILSELRRVGILIEGGIRIESSPRSPDLPVLSKTLSPPLAEIAQPILQDSVNWLAEMLLRVLAAELTGEGRSDTGLEILATFLEEDIGLSPSAFHLDDASGVSPYNLVSATCLVELLRFADRQEWKVPYRAALATPGSGTLEMWPPLPDLVAKTGTLRHTAALAGYLASKNESPVVFAVILDHRTEEPSELRKEIAELVAGLNPETQ